MNHSVSCIHVSNHLIQVDSNYLVAETGAKIYLQIFISCLFARQTTPENEY